MQVGAGGDVPEEFYMPKEDPEREKLATSVNVKKGAKHKVPVTVQEECVIKYVHVKSASSSTHT